MKLTNISVGKIIGIGNVTILPGETKDIPEGYENNPIVEHYEKLGLALVIGKSVEVSEGTIAPKKRGRKPKDSDSDEALRKARLASLDGISVEALASLARELGVNPADCKDNDDVLAKVKKALEAK